MDSLTLHNGRASVVFDPKKIKDMGPVRTHVQDCGAFSQGDHTGWPQVTLAQKVKRALVRWPRLNPWLFKVGAVGHMKGQWMGPLWSCNAVVIITQKAISCH